MISTVVKKSASTVVLIVVLVCLAVLVFFVWHTKTPESLLPPVSEAPKDVWPDREVIGSSVLGRAIESFTYGGGNTHLLFVGGIHGGYEWNSVLLSYQFMEYLEGNQKAVPENFTITVIPSLNPDGVYTVVGKEGRFTVADVSVDAEVLASGRFNAHGVDLNRNFDCKWKPESMWRSKTVSAGTEAFSEPEAAALRNFVLKNNPDTVVFWHSRANAVYASECRDGILPKTLDIMNAYAEVTGYRAVKSFDSYEITGDAEGWLASIGIPAITIELQTHETVEWERNLRGIKALFEYFSSPSRASLGRSF